MDWKSIWHKLILIMGFNVGSRELLQPTHRTNRTRPETSILFRILRTSSKVVLVNWCKGHGPTRWCHHESLAGENLASCTNSSKPVQMQPPIASLLRPIVSHPHNTDCCLSILMYFMHCTKEKEREKELMGSVQG